MHWTGCILDCPRRLRSQGCRTVSSTGEQIADGIVADVLKAGENSPPLHAALSEAEVILDMSANIPVARYLCRDVDAHGRRISLFLNPSGTALTLLAEDKARQIPLDVLEMQLYREIANNPELSGLLESTGRLRTGQSCRDLSTQIPQDLVALHAAIGSHAVRRVLDSELAPDINMACGTEHTRCACHSEQARTTNEEKVGEVGRVHGFSTPGEAGRPALRAAAQ